MTPGRINRVRVRTPEGVVFTFVLAGPFTRMLAWIVDAALIAAAGSVLGTLVGVITPINPDWAAAIAVVGYFVISTGYGIVSEWLWRGQTLGKKLLQLRVVDEAGLPLGASQVILRNLLRAVDVLPVAYLVGGAAMILSPRAQRLGDLAAGTIVVRHVKIPEPDFGQLFAGKFNSLREHPTLAARLRQQTPPELAGAGVEALLRRAEFEPGARVALFAELACAYAGVVSFPPETVAGMPDEAFVRNVVEIIHSPSGVGEFTSRAATRAVSATT